MNREEAKSIIKHFACVKAFAEGKIIEYRGISGNEWMRVDTPSFCANGEYRVKPEPRRRWNIEFDNGHIWSSNILSEARAKDELAAIIRRHGNDKVLRIVEYVEVTK